MKPFISILTVALLVFPSSRALAAVGPRLSAATRPVIATHRFSGTLQRAHTVVLMIRLRTGQLLPVDTTQAAKANRIAKPLFIGKPLMVEGNLIGGVLAATVVDSLTPAVPYWPPDR